MEKKGSVKHESPEAIDERRLLLAHRSETESIVAARAALINADIELKVMQFGGDYADYG